MAYKVEPYEILLEKRTIKRGKHSQRTPLSPQMKALLHQQNTAREMAHASNLRTMNNACDTLENWARRSRYGG